MLFQTIGICIIFVVILAVFIFYVVYTNRIISEQQKEIAELSTTIKRLNHKLTVANTPKPITSEDLKIKVPIFGDSQ